MKLLTALAYFAFALFSPIQLSAQSTLFKGTSKGITKHKLLGRFIYISKTDSRNSFGYEYYFILSSKKGQSALPVKIRSNKVASDIKANLGKQYLIQAVPTNENIFVGESKKTVKVLNIINARSIDLASVGYVGPDTNTAQVSHKKNMRSDTPQFTIDGINDTVTNTIIFTAGAALLGSILLSK